MDTQPYEDQLNAALAALHTAQTLLRAEIAAYPTPISGCDQQYIRLMSDRTRIASAIQDLSRQPFVATPRHLDETAA